MESSPPLALRANRIESLDALRGLAALAVVLAHIMITLPAVEDVITDSSGAPTWLKAVTYSPLHLFWAGTEAVYVFFILSGFVLTLPFVNGKTPHWRSYYPARLARLYLPVIAAVLFALVMAWVIPRVPTPGASDYVNEHGEPSTPITDMLLVGEISPLNSPLWSLQWEVLFSLLLPLYILVCVRWKRLWPLWLLLSAAAIGAGAITGNRAILFLPMFALGAILATRMDAVRRLASKTDKPVHLLVWCAAVVLLLARWVLPMIPGSAVLASVGALILVAMFAVSPAAHRLGRMSVLRWAGSRSFSIYLFHEPVLMSVVFFFEPATLAPALLVGVPLILITSELAFRVVERPSTRLSKAIQRGLSPRVRNTATVPGN